MPVDSLNQTAEGIPDSNPKECALSAMRPSVYQHKSPSIYVV